MVNLYANIFIIHLCMNINSFYELFYIPKKLVYCSSDKFNEIIKISLYIKPNV